MHCIRICKATKQYSFNPQKNAKKVKRKSDVYLFLCFCLSCVSSPRKPDPLNPKYLVWSISCNIAAYLEGSPVSLDPNGDLKSFLKSSLNFSTLHCFGRVQMFTKIVATRPMKLRYHSPLHLIQMCSLPNSVCAQCANLTHRLSNKSLLWSSTSLC